MPINNPMSVKKKAKPGPTPATRRTGTGSQMVAALAGKAKFLSGVRKNKK